MDNKDYESSKIVYQGVNGLNPWQLKGRLENLTKYKLKNDNKK